MSTEVQQNRSGFEGSQPVILPKAHLRKALFANGPALPKISMPHVSDIANGTMYWISDMTGLARSGMDVISSYIAVNPNSSLAHLGSLFSAKDTVLAYHAFGSASGINTVIGLVQMKQDFDQLAYIGAIGDKRGLLMKRLALAKDGALAGAGVSFLAFRPLAMAGAIENASSTSLLGRATSGAAYFGMVFYALFFAVFSGIFGIQLYEGLKFRRKLNRAEDLAGKIEVLQNQLNVNPGRLFNKMVEKEKASLPSLSEEEAVAAARKALIDEALASSRESIRSLMGELGLEEVSEEQVDALIHRVMGSAYEGKTAEQVRELVEVDLAFTGLKMKVQTAQLKKQSKASRLVTGKGMESLKELSKKGDLAGRVREGDAVATAEAEKLLETIKASNRSKLTETGIVLGVLVAGVVAMILPLVLVSGPALLVASIVMLVFSIAMAGVDGHYLLQSFKGERPAPHDKKMLILSMAVGVASFLSIAALVASGVITMGIFPLVLTIVLAGLWLAQNGVTWFVINRNEKKHLLENPTLESFLEMLESKEGQETIMKCLENFPEEVKAQVEAELEALQGDERETLKEATRKVIEKVEEAKKEGLEALREELLPFLVTSN